MPTITIGQNSYVSLTQAESHFDARLHAAAWTEAGDEIKIRALIMAAMLLDRHIIWKGYKLDQDQAMEWPRTGISWAPPGVVPPAVQLAQMELALLLLGKDLTAPSDMAGYKAMEIAGAVKLTIDAATTVKTIPDSVFDYIRMYGSRSGGINSVQLTR